MDKNNKNEIIKKDIKNVYPVLVWVMVENFKKIYRVA